VWKLASDSETEIAPLPSTLLPIKKVNISLLKVERNIHFFIFEA
jgi:hypothetical protein